MDGAETIRQKVVSEMGLINWIIHKVTKGRIRFWSEEEVEDFRSALILHMLEKAHKFDPEKGSFGTWCFWQCRHVAGLHAYHKNRDRVLSSMNLGDHAEKFLDPHDQFEQYDSEQFTSTVVSRSVTIIKEMPEKTRDAVWAVYIKGRSINQLSRSNGGRTTLQKRVRRGRAVLREELERKEVF